MIRKAFPDLHWLKRQVEHELTHGRGWPTLIMNASTTRADRPDIRGPLTIFTNISGTSFTSAGGRRVAVNEQVYFISNQEQHYSIGIDSTHPVETFNFHLGPDMADRVLQGVVQPAQALLERDFERPETGFGFFNRLYARDERFDMIVRSLQTADREGVTSALFYEEKLTLLLEHLLSVHGNTLRIVAGLPPVKTSTRVEVFKRLSMATDYIYTHYNRDVTLDELSSAACLSRFHFLRLFRQAFGTTPYRFLTDVRMARARVLLRDTRLAVHEIAETLGFDASPSFSRAFRRAVGVYPDAWRSALR